MSLDTPAKIAVLGAGPIGLEAALYARFLGYQVEVFERGQIADSVRRWGHVRMFSEFTSNASPLGQSALLAQDAAFRLPAPASLLTGQEYLDHYLCPLAETDLLAGCVFPQTAVMQVAREPSGLANDTRPVESSPPLFRLLLAERGSAQLYATANAVIDCTGTLLQPQGCGPGGLPAMGEADLRQHIEYNVPDALGRQQADYANRHTLVIGHDETAALTISLLGELSRSHPQTQVTWVSGHDGASPIHSVADDPLPHRQAVKQRADGWLHTDPPIVRHWPSSWVERLQRDEPGRFRAQLIGQHAGELIVDRVVANAGYRPDLQLHAAVPWPPLATLGTQAIGGDDAASSAIASAAQRAEGGAAPRRTSVPNLFILGSKGHFAPEGFLISQGLEQIRRLFTLLVGRADLNLYENARRLLR